MMVNIDTTTLTAVQKQTVDRLKSTRVLGGSPNLNELTSSGIKFETINGNHRREAGVLLKEHDSIIYYETRFAALVYVDLTSKLAFMLASKANLDSWEIRKNTFYEDIRALRQVIIYLN
jgi:hypothetical protein